MLNLSAKEGARDVTQLSDAELISTLAAQAKELGIEIDLSYSFAQQPSATGTDDQDSQVIDNNSESHKRKTALGKRITGDVRSATAPRKHD